jgi:hypothetical protein
MVIFPLEAPALPPMPAPPPAPVAVKLPGPVMVNERLTEGGGAK